MSKQSAQIYIFLIEQLAKAPLLTAASGHPEPRRRVYRQFSSDAKYAKLETASQNFETPFLRPGVRLLDAGIWSPDGKCQKSERLLKTMKNEE